MFLKFNNNNNNKNIAIFTDYFQCFIYKRDAGSLIIWPKDRIHFRSETLKMPTVGSLLVLDQN